MAQFKGVRKISQKQYKKLKDEKRLDNSVLYVTPDKNLPVLQGTEAPTTETIGELTQFYLDLTNKKLYQCVGIVDTTYEWQAVGAGVSQEDFDKLVNNEVQIKSVEQGFKIGGASSVYHGIAIGDNAYTVGSVTVAAIAIGEDSRAQGAGAIAIGDGAKCSGVFSIQLGGGSNAKDNTLQIRSDNIYNFNTHTLTVQNIELNGEDLGTKLANVGGALYEHVINITATDLRVIIKIVNKTQDVFTYDTLQQLFINNGNTTLDSCYPANGIRQTTNVYGIYYDSDFSKLASVSGTSSNTITDPVISDKVRVI